MFDEQLVRESFEQSWSRDFCAQFRDTEDFLARGIGVGALFEGKLVAGASSYSIYRGGIEIEIDTKPEFRRQGLATTCGAKLILECLSRGLYPSWDAYDLRSVSLAEKLGYHLDRPYVVYALERRTCVSKICRSIRPPNNEIKAVPVSTGTAFLIFVLAHRRRARRGGRRLRTVTFPLFGQER